jgi:YfiR/HmsC-like
MTIYKMGTLKGIRVRQLFRGIILFSLLALMGNISVTQVQAQADEYQVKAAFVFNFAKFVEWPSDAFSDGGTLVVGVVGDDPFGGALDRLNGSSANGRRLRIKRFRMGDNLRACNILFISKSENRNLGKILESLKGTSVLTIGETPQFNQSGGMIRFVIQNSKVRFEINAAAAAQTRLKISSKLMALSKGGN